MDVKTFVNTFAPYAVASEKKTGVPAVFSLAQSALETGWGGRVAGNNMFGIKDTQEGVPGVYVWTTEYNRTTGLWQRIKQLFRKYASPEESFTDHGNFLKNNPRYRAAFNVSRYPDLFAQLVAKAGYATDPDYAEKIIAIIRLINPFFNQTNPSK